VQTVSQLEGRLTKAGSHDGSHALEVTALSITSSG